MSPMYEIGLSIHFSPLSLEFTTTYFTFKLKCPSPAPSYTGFPNQPVLEVGTLITSPLIGYERQSRTADGEFVNELDFFFIYA